MHVIATHKATGNTYRSGPMNVFGINYAPDERKCIRLAIDQMRRDGIVDIDQPDDYQFDIVST
jgi:hypothetical protein